MSDFFETLIDLFDISADLPSGEKRKPDPKVFIVVVLCVALCILLFVNQSWYAVADTFILGSLTVFTALVLAVSTIFVLNKSGKLHNLSIEWFLLLTILGSLIYATGLLYLNYKLKLIV